MKQKLTLALQKPNSRNSENPWQLTVKSIDGRLPENDGFIPNFKQTLAELLPKEHDTQYGERNGTKFAYLAQEPGVAELDVHRKGYKFTVTIPNNGPIEGQTFIDSYVNRLSQEYELDR